MNNCPQDFNNREKPLWSDHDYPAICICGDGNWFGLHDPVKPPYSDEWKGKEVHILREKGGFLKYGKSIDDIENGFEVRPKL